MHGGEPYGERRQFRPPEQAPAARRRAYAAATGTTAAEGHYWNRALPDADLCRRRVGHGERSGSSEPSAGRLGWLNQNYGLGLVIDSRGQSPHEIEVTCA